MFVKCGDQTRDLLRRMPLRQIRRQVIPSVFTAKKSSQFLKTLLLCKGVFSVTRIWPRTRDWLACVAPTKNNFICVFIVKRDKRMRGARRCAWRYDVTIANTVTKTVEN
jgi:hypothetical protein